MIFTRNSLPRRLRRCVLAGAIRVALAFVRVLPRDLAVAAAESAGRAVAPLLPGIYRLARRQNAAAFPPGTPSRDVARAARGVFGFLARSAVETVTSRSFSARRLAGLVENSDEAEARVAEFRAGGRGVIILTAHLGNWELLGAWGASRFPVSGVARRMSYEGYESVLREIREAHGIRTIYHDGPPRELIRALRRNDLLAILADQDIPRIGGVHCDFFGRPAYTPTAPVSLALLTGAPLVLCVLVFERGRYRIVLDGPIELRRTGDRDADIREGTAEWSRRLEALIRRHPEQWPWFHKRWKTTPEKLAARRRRDREREAARGSRMD